MAMNPAGFEVKTVENIDEYLDELFSQGPDGLPSFYDFLSEMRGIPREFFTRDQYLMLALNSEMSYYTMFVNSAFAKQKQTAEQTEQKAAYIASLETASLEELVAHANKLKSELERAQEADKAGHAGAAEAFAMYSEQLPLVEAAIMKAGQELSASA